MHQETSVREYSAHTIIVIPLFVLVASFESTYSTNYPHLMAVSLVATASVLLVFLVVKKQLSRLWLDWGLSSDS